MADGLNYEAAADGLAALIMTIPGIQSVIIGSPTGMNVSSTVWVTLGDPGFTEMKRAGGVYESSANLIAWFSYAITDEDATIAERSIMQSIVEFVKRVARNRRDTVDGVAPFLNGTVVRMELPRSAASPSDYVIMAGQPTRLFPIALPVYQQENFGV